jgi:predicted Zn-dependent protease
MRLENLKNILILLLERAINFRSLAFFFVIFFTQYSVAVVQVLDAETEDVVRDLITPILSQAGENPDTVRIYILLDDNINAFVSGGRNIFINTGVITAFNDPDVLKGVVAHELGHISGGHLARTDEKVRELQKQSWAAISLIGIASVLSGRPDAILGGIAGQSHLLSRDYLSYSRSQEAAADQASVRYLHGSGNTLKGVIKLLEYFNKKESQYLKGVNPYAVTHPLSETRLSTLKIALENEPKSFGSSDVQKEKYARIVAKLRGFLRKSTKSDAVIDEDLDQTSRKYEQAVIFYERHNVKSALGTINSLIHKEPDNGYFYELRAQILLRAGYVDESLSSYQKSIEYVKNPLILAEYGLALINSAESYQDKNKRDSNLRKGIAQLESALAQGFRNSGVFRTLAVAYGKLDDFGYSNLMLAEEAMEQHKYDEAKRFLKIAEKYSENRSGLKLKIEDIMNQIDKKDS